MIVQTRLSSIAFDGAAPFWTFLNISMRKRPIEAHDILYLFSYLVRDIQSGIFLV